MLGRIAERDEPAPVDIHVALFGQIVDVNYAGLGIQDALQKVFVVLQLRLRLLALTDITHTDKNDVPVITRDWL